MRCAKMTRIYHVLAILPIYLGISGVNCQSFSIMTHPCERNNGSEIAMKATYNSLPGDPVEIIAPGVRIISSCQPNVSCAPPISGYNVTNSNQGKLFHITISQARDIDIGEWRVTDGVAPTLTTDLQLTRDLMLTKINCSSGSDTNKFIAIAQGVQETVTCSSEAIDTNLTLSFVLEQNDTPAGGFVNESGATLTGSGVSFWSSITLDDSQGLSGNYTLCYKLSTTNCSYTQDGDLCYTAEFPETTTTPWVTSEQTSLTTISSNNDSGTPTIVMITDSPPSTDVISPESATVATPISDTSSPGDTRTVSTSSANTSTSQGVSSQSTSTPETSTPPTTCALCPRCNATGLIVVLVVACLLAVIGIGAPVVLFLKWSGKANYRIILISLAVVSACFAVGAIIATGIGLGAEDCSAHLYVGIALTVISGSVLIGVCVSAWYLYKPPLRVENSGNNAMNLNTVPNGGHK